MQRYQDSIINTSGDAVAGASVLVKTLAGATATIYANNGTTVGTTPSLLYNREYAGGLPRLVADISRARRLLNWQPQTNLAAGLARLYAEDPGIRLYLSARQHARSGAAARKNKVGGGVPSAPHPLVGGGAGGPGGS